MSGRLRLLPSGALEVEVTGHDVEEMFARVRVLSARENVARLGRDLGYRVEDAAEVHVEGAPDPELAARWLRRRLPSGAAVECVRGEPPMRMTARLESRRPEIDRRYAVGEDGRVAVESVELHVIEHCNLRCAQCCNVSPYLADRALSVEAVRATCTRLRSALRPDVLKIMGGEPLLHPDIGGVLRAARESEVAPRVRLFTNGLFLRSMSDEAFAALDELTVSRYASAPVKDDVIAETAERARRFDVVLNVKDVASFSTVLVAEPRSADEIRATYDACWLRHRCLVVRGGAFYKCTRAAYHADFHRRVAIAGADDAPERTQSSLGIPLDAADFAERVAAHLSSPEPLASCTHCLGSTGPLAPHVQLRKRDVAAGLLS